MPVLLVKVKHKKSNDGTAHITRKTQSGIQDVISIDDGKWKDDSSIPCENDHSSPFIKHNLVNNKHRS